MLSASSCEFIEVEMCQGLSYNLTSFPNIWLSIADQREAATLLRQYRVKKLPSKLTWFPFISLLLLYYPQKLGRLIKKTNNTLTALHKLVAMASFNNCSAISSQTFNLTHSSFLHFCHPGADGAGVLRALAQAGVWNVFAPVQPTGWRPPALPLRLLLCWEAMQPGPGSLLLQLAIQLPPPARLTGPHGVLPALRPQEFEFSVALFLRDELLHPSVLWCLRTDELAFHRPGYWFSGHGIQEMCCWTHFDYSVTATLITHYCLWSLWCMQTTVAQQSFLEASKYVNEMFRVFWVIQIPRLNEGFPISLSNRNQTVVNCLFALFIAFDVNHVKTDLTDEDWMNTEKTFKITFIALFINTPHDVLISLQG